MMKLDDIISNAKMFSQCSGLSHGLTEADWQGICNLLSELRKMRRLVCFVADKFPAGEYKLSTKQILALNELVDAAASIRNRH